MDPGPLDPWIGMDSDIAVVAAATVVVVGQQAGVEWEIHRQLLVHYVAGIVVDLAENIAA